MNNNKCKICPRECLADRENGQPGACGVDNKIYVARAALHMWEEPCISGTKGSGTVFFVGCSLGCIYCQNYEISRIRDRGKNISPVSADELADIFLDLQNKGANNINLVTPTHYAYQIIEAVKIAKSKGLFLPIVYNTSGYESIETLKKLQGIVDIYLSDFKYMNGELARLYSKAENYPEVAIKATKEMVRQQPVCEFSSDDQTIESGILKRGVIVRNLLLPGNVNNSKAVVKHLYEEYGDSIYISIMNQYTPLSQVGGISPLNRKVTKREYNRLIDYTISLGAKNVYIQDGDVASESFIPDFKKC